MLHLRVQCCGFEVQQFRRPALVPVALVERTSDQLDLVAFDLVVEVDLFIIVLM